jgi:hypothetical protein
MLEPARQAAIVEALLRFWRRRAGVARRGVVIESINDVSALRSDLAPVFIAAGARRTPQGLAVTGPGPSLVP